jgi:hypothetical protein
MIRRVHFAASVAGIFALPTVALAQIETQASAKFGTSVGYSSSPFASNGGGSGYTELRVSPLVTLRTERDTLTLLGSAQLQQYFRRYSLRDNYSATANYVGRYTDRLTVNGGVSYINAISGSDFSGAILPEQVDPELPLIGTDLGLFGTGNRRQSISGRAGATLLLSSVDQINVYGSAVSTHNSRRGQAVNYHGYGGGLGYSRRLNDSLRVGVTGSVNRASYTSNATTTVYGVEGTFDARFNERLTLNGSLGVSRVESSGAAPLLGTLRSQTTLSGHANLCRASQTGRACLGVSRAILPSSFGGARIQTSVDATYNMRLSEVSSVTARSAFTNVNGSRGGTFGRFRYWTNSVEYQRRLGERLSATAMARYRSIGGGAGSITGLNRRKDDVGGSVGLSYALGNVR